MATKPAMQPARCQEKPVCLHHLHPSPRPSLSVNHLPPLLGPHPGPKSNRTGSFDLAGLMRV